jgi:hypothetical protein
MGIAKHPRFDRPKVHSEHPVAPPRLDGPPMALRVHGAGANGHATSGREHRPPSPFAQSAHGRHVGTPKGTDAGS